MAQMCLLTDVCPQAQTRVWPNACFIGNPGIVHMSKGLDMRACANYSVFDDAMRPDTHTVGQLDTAFEHATHVYEYVATAMQLAAQVKAGRVSQGHALLKQATRSEEQRLNSSH